MKKVEFKVNDKVKSIAGHDKDKIFTIIDVLNDRFVLLSNDTIDIALKTKLKNVKHIRKV